MNSTYWAPFAAHNTRTVQVKRSTPILCNLIRLILNLFHQIAQELLMGLMTSHSQKVDLNMAPGTKHCELILDSFSSRFIIMFSLVSIYVLIDLLMADLGRDKMATIIQSGRDHGLPTYTQVHCQLAIWPQLLYLQYPVNLAALPCLPAGLCTRSLYPPCTR